MYNVYAVYLVPLFTEINIHNNKYIYTYCPYIYIIQKYMKEQIPYRSSVLESEPVEPKLFWGQPEPLTAISGFRLYGFRAKICTVVFLFYFSSFYTTLNHF